MGDVFLGVREDSQFASRVAVKCVRRGVDNDQIIARFKTERRILGAMHHPGIARLLDGGMAEDGSPYLVMEYIEGQPIDTYCDRHRLNIEDRLRLFMRVCDAVHFAHQNLVIHRDLKPANILVTEKGDPKLLDFGIAKLVNPDLALIEHAPTLTRFRLMTPEYASPEQVRQEPITTASDIYSLGVILFELLTGHRPYRLERNTQDELERIICEQAPDRPSTALSRVEERRTRTRTGEMTTRVISPVEVSHARDGRIERLRRKLAGDLDNIVLMALRKESQRRYRSAEELARDIERHLDGMPVVARPDTVGYRASKFVGRNRVAVAGAMAVMGALVLGMAGTSYMHYQAIDERDRAERALVEAERLRAIADNRLGQLQDISSQMLALYDEIDTAPGQLQTGDALVRSAIATLESLGDEAREDPVVAIQLADAYDRIGEIQGGNRQANFGLLDDALVSFTKSKEIYAQHAATTVRAALGSGKASIKIADVIRRKGDTAAALKRYEEARDIAGEVLALEPNNRDAKRLRASALLSCADAMWDVGERSDAEAAYAESVRIREELARGGAADSVNTRDLAIGLGRLGRARLAAGDPSGALDVYARSRTLRVLLQEQAGVEDARATRDLFVIDIQIAQAHGMLGDLTKQRDSLRSGCDVAAEMVRLDPDDQRAKRDLAVVLERLGDAEADLGNLTAAKSAYLDAVEAVRAFRLRSPDNQTGARLDMSSKSRLGSVLADLGNTDAAAPYLDQSERLINEAGGLDAPFRLQMLGAIWKARGVGAASKNDARLAASFFQRAITHYNELPAETRLDTLVRLTLADLHRRRAESLLAFDPQSARDEAATALSEFGALGQYGKRGAAESEAIECDAASLIGVLNPGEMVVRITAVITGMDAPPAGVLRRLARAQYDAGSAQAAIETVEKAILQLDDAGAEGWEPATLRRTLVEDRTRYSSAAP
jgi:tetratricopeptide (TPR) repeat protein